jgi:hypothetical protein
VQAGRVDHHDDTLTLMAKVLVEPHEGRQVAKRVREHPGRLARSRGRYEGHREVQHLYVFEGEGDEIREFWEKMTKVRMEFFEEPGRVEQASGYRVLPTPIC